ncbi:hypothetical protein ACSSNL_08815 [Thalassobius sp. S69A]|uniref:hypothetical protein n=1 Tax=unclassified Thalassovita TaxID=2619711 RepID=UPI003C7D82B6
MEPSSKSRTCPVQLSICAGKADIPNVSLCKILPNEQTFAIPDMAPARSEESAQQAFDRQRPFFVRSKLPFAMFLTGLHQVLCLQKLATPQMIVFGGLAQDILNSRIFGIGNIHSNTHRNFAAFDGPEQPVFATLQKPKNPAHIFHRQVGLARDFSIKIPPALQALDVMKQIQGPVLAALRRELGGSHQAIKASMNGTGVCERAAKNWLAGAHGPAGEHLIELMRHSDEVAETVRPYVAEAKWPFLWILRVFGPDFFEC